MPIPSGAPPRRRRARAGRRGASAVAALAGLSGDSQLLLDLGDLAVLGVEELGGHLVPAAELVDLEELGRGGVALLVGQRLQHGAVALLGEDRLGLLAAEEV